MTDPTEGPSAIEFMFHPTFLTSDRRKAAEWIERVFRRTGVYQGEFMKELGAESAYPADYSFYVWFSDVWFDVIQPDLYQLPSGAGGLQSPLDRLSELGWHASDAAAVYLSAKRQGVRVLDQRGLEVTADTLPKGTSLVDPDVVLVWLDPRDVGLGVEVAEMSPPFREFNSRSLFPRFRKDWVHPSPSAEDPLGLVRGSHHTVLTRNIERSLRGTVDVLGGKIFHRAENRWLSTQSTFVFLADSVIEYAEIPDDGHALASEWEFAPSTLIGQQQQDIYYAITFLVTDLEKSAVHLQQEGIGLAYRSANLIVTDPRDCLGMRWGFSSALMPGDPR